MKPEYIGVGNFDTDNFVYSFCNCHLSTDYAIKWPLIKDGKPHRYTCICEDCGAEIMVISKSYAPEVYKEKEKLKDAISREAVLDLISDYDLSMGQVVKGVHALPPATPQPKIGHWIFTDEAHEHARCSECDYGDIDLMDGKPHNYCQNCGTKIQKVRDENEHVWRKRL